MRTYSSPWEVAGSGVKTVVIEQAVLDQILHGNHYVYSEIQALQDLGLTVGLLHTGEDRAEDSRLTNLRRAVSDQLELERLGVTYSWWKSTALWRLPHTQVDGGAADLDEADRYEPDILMESPVQPLPPAKAERLARRIGALR